MISNRKFTKIIRLIEKGQMTVQEALDYVNAFEKSGKVINILKNKFKYEYAQQN
jgi:hypothetical protein